MEMEWLNNHIQKKKIKIQTLQQSQKLTKNGS